MSGAINAPNSRPGGGSTGARRNAGGPRPKPVPTGLVLGIALLVISLIGFAAYMLLGGPEADAGRAAAGRAGNSAGPKDDGPRLTRKASDH